MFHVELGNRRPAAPWVEMFHVEQR